MSELTQEEIAEREKYLRWAYQHQEEDSIAADATKAELNYIETLRALQAENAQLREALTFYAQEENNEPNNYIRGGAWESNVEIDWGDRARKALQQPSQSYERYQVMQKVCEAAKVWNSEPDDADEWANATLRLSQAVDALEALDQ